jgi:hypothetical protein
MHELDVRVHADHCTGGVEVGRVAGKRRQLFARARGMRALIQNVLPESCDLIAANDDGVRIALRNRLRLQNTQAAGAQRWWLPDDHILGDIRRQHVERQRETRQERAPIGGRGGQQKSSHGA